jgi:hypothetical protein
MERLQQKLKEKLFTPAALPHLLVIIQTNRLIARSFMALAVGTAAPDFDLPAVTGEEKNRFKLSDHRGKQNIVLAFHPLDWTPV